MKRGSTEWLTGWQTYPQIFALQPFAVVLLDVHFVDEVRYVEGVVGNDLSELQVDLRSNDSVNEWNLGRIQ